MGCNSLNQNPNRPFLPSISATGKGINAIAQQTLVSGAFLRSGSHPYKCSVLWLAREILWDLSSLPVFCGPMFSSRTPAFFVLRWLQDGSQKADSQGLLYVWSASPHPQLVYLKFQVWGYFFLSVDSEHAVLVVTVRPWLLCRWPALFLSLCFGSS